jgi:hypothetical protein
MFSSLTIPRLQQQRNSQVEDDESPIATRRGIRIESPPSQHQSISQAPPLPAPLPKPVLKINSTNVLAKVEHMPRRHLGSGLYSVKFTPPSHATASTYEKWGSATVAMQYVPARRFSAEEENCTFTVRVAREFLTRDMRQKLCADRYLFGTEVHTDDSDPLLAAMHAGYIRGAWPPDIDESLIDIPTPPPDSPVLLPKEGQEIVGAPTSGPQTPAEELDVHIKLLVLPRLRNYASTIRFGIKSHTWGRNHDGQSVMVLGVKWVDEGAGRRIVNGAKGKKERMRLAMAGNNKKRKLENGAGAMNKRGRG